MPAHIRSDHIGTHSISCCCLPRPALGKEPSQLTIEQIDAPLISSFLDDLENRRGISARSRNLRLTAIRSFFRFAAFELPAQSAPIQRVLAIPCKRCVHEQIHYLTRPEVDALLAAPDQTTWSGRRDHAWLLLAVQTGLRLSELTGLTTAGCSVRGRRPCPRARQRPKGTLHAADEADRGRVASVAERTSAWRRANRVPQSPGRENEQ